MLPHIKNSLFCFNIYFFSQIIKESPISSLKSEQTVGCVTKDLSRESPILTKKKSNPLLLEISSKFQMQKLFGKYFFHMQDKKKVFNLNEKLNFKLIISACFLVTLHFSSSIMNTLKLSSISLLQAVNVDLTIKKKNIFFSLAFKLKTIKKKLLITFTSPHSKQNVAVYID